MGFELDPKRGVLNFYGVRTTDSTFGGEIDDDVIHISQWTFNYNNLPTAATNNLGQSIPANARIISAKLEIITAFTSSSTTTDLDIGLYTAAGAAISASGLITAAEATQTTIATAGNIINGTAGALINKTIGTTPGELQITPTVVDLLTGKGRVIVYWLAAGL